MFKSRVVFLGAALLAGAMSSANAADVYSRGESLKDGAYDAPAIHWAGFYAGIHAGAVVGDDTTFNLAVTAGETFTTREQGDAENAFLAGVHVGYNWQLSNIVLGVEGDISALGGKRDVEDQGFKLAEQDDKWLASIRGRLGYAAGPLLIYGTGGVAFLNGELTYPDGTKPFDDSVTGWVAGGGVEYKLDGNWSLGVEGLYYAFDDEATEIGDGGIRFDRDYDRDFWTVRARVSYQFGDYNDEPLK
ncbi:MULTISPECIES: outer membrane beta-barrel protein [Rhodomicrobium]|uniref:outer membrane protein n=1 Tax=Rhodomicrobium TaxID=1068 RepID=UPI000F742389|nr:MULTISPECIES: outer membrane beta-barrel protein [Rhodomicrobium]